MYALLGKNHLYHIAFYPDVASTHFVSQNCVQINETIAVGFPHFITGKLATIKPLSQQLIKFRQEKHDYFILKIRLVPP